MTVILNSANGVPLEDFIANHQLEGKSIVYVIGNRIASDRHRRKIGKSYNGTDRLKAYMRAYGKRSRTDKSAGAKIYYAEVVPPRPKNMAGTPLVDAKENYVKTTLKRTVKGRGTEWIEATHNRFVDAFRSAPTKGDYTPRRSSSRVPTCPRVCRPRKDGSSTMIIKD